MMLTDRDLDVIETLSCRVPFLSLKQAVHIWWPGCSPGRTAHRRLKQLVDANWLRLYTINLPRLPASLVPLSAWSPGMKGPDPRRIAEKSQTRNRHAAIPTAILTASAASAAMMGGASSGAPAPEYRQRGAHLAAVHVLYRQKRPNLARQWAGGGALTRSESRQRTVDVLLRDANSRQFGVIHVAGRWRPAQVERFHDDCRQSDLPYELW